MRYIITTLLVLFFGAFFLQTEAVESKDALLESQMALYPKEVQYGDILCMVIQIKNVGKQSSSVVVNMWEGGYSGWELGISDSPESRTVLEWLDKDAVDVADHLPDARKDKWFFIPPTDILPGKSTIIAFRPVWLPPMSHEGNAFRAEYGQQLIKNPITFFVHSKDNRYVHYVNDENLRRQKYNLFYESPASKIIVNPRKKEMYDILREWFQEIPGPYHWTDGLLFQLINDDRDSPFYLSDELPEKERLAERRKQPNWDNKFLSFLEQTETRTELIERRIRRADELAAKLTVLSDSIVSPYMKEFIHLRGLLINLRYAGENKAARDAAFDKITTWLKTAKYKTLWVLLVKNSGLPSIVNGEHFPKQVTYEYIDKLIKLFPKESDVTISDLDKEYGVLKKE